MTHLQSLFPGGIIHKGAAQCSWMAAPRHQIQTPPTLYSPALQVAAIVTVFHRARGTRDKRRNRREVSSPLEASPGDHAPRFSSSPLERKESRGHTKLQGRLSKIGSILGDLVCVKSFKGELGKRREVDNGEQMAVWGTEAPGLWKSLL